MSIKKTPVRKVNVKPKAARPQARPASIDINALDSREQKASGAEPQKMRHDYPSATPKVKKNLSSGQKARRKRALMRRIRMTFLLLLLLAVCGAAGFGAVYFLRDGSFTELNKPYSLSTEFTNKLTHKEELRAVPFASDLCVVSEDVPLETATLGNDQNGLLVDIDNKEVLYSLGALDRVYPASITKIMTALLVLKYGDLDETITITQEDLNLEEGAQVCGFIAGDQLTVEQLLYCLLVYSGNDAAAALSRNIAGNEADFVSMMNTYAEQLGCTGTHFTNPHGLQDPDHYTTCYDIYLMLNEAYKYPVFTQISQLPGYTVNYTRADGTVMATYLEATDHYLTGDSTAPKDVTILGGKTGTTKDAGNCLALLSQNAYGHPFCSIVMGATTKDVLYQEMNSLLQVINEA